MNATLRRLAALCAAQVADLEAERAYAALVARLRSDDENRRTA